MTTDNRLPCEKFADRINRRFRGFYPTLARWFHAHRCYIAPIKPMNVSVKCRQETGINEVPVGELVTIYFFRGKAYRFWKGVNISADTVSSIMEGLHKEWRWHVRYCDEQFGPSL